MLSKNGVGKHTQQQLDVVAEFAHQEPVKAQGLHNLLFEVHSSNKPEHITAGPSLLGKDQERDIFTSDKIWIISVVMILPQVHLRKPCYDFTFL